jgi:indolepyruvate ferredoxin oxidoreductase alpha subunit
MMALLMGNEAIGLGAIKAGVQVVTGYPGTPSTEVLETIAKNNDGSIYVEWSVNEKAALEVAAGAAYTGVRSLVTMKQVGLNVASDPLMSLAYIGVKGGMIVLAADDPGPNSSQTEQDTRTFAMFSKLPVFDPSSPEEAYRMMKDAFELSEKYSTPVIMRPTTRVCHACSSVDESMDEVKHREGKFEKDPRYVIFPKLSFEAHRNIEKRNAELGDELSSYRYNTIEGSGKLGIITGGVSYLYVKEAVAQLGIDPMILRIGTPFPFPEKLALEFAKKVDRMICIEELDPYLERAMIFTLGRNQIKKEVSGKLDGKVPSSGENQTEAVIDELSDYLGIPKEKKKTAVLPALPVRPPVLCAGCPHRASFYAVKRALKGKRAVFCGDIGCYTLGNAMPLDMVDTCLCMGADITVAQGITRGEKGVPVFSFIGDSTFFHTGIPGVINAVYNKTDITVIVLDNSTTAMTGHQPHPGTGKTAMGTEGVKVSIQDILRACGVTSVEIVDPLDLDKAIDTVRNTYTKPGVKAVIFKSPCIALEKTGRPLLINNDKCTGCRTCIKELGCPALVSDGKKVKIDKGLCNGCRLCSKICPFDAIGGVDNAK